MVTDNLQLTNVIRNILTNKEMLVPIYTNEIFVEVKRKLPKTNRQVFNTYMGRVIKKYNDIERYQKGIYYKTVSTPFGKATINELEFLKNYYICDNNNTVGYETGPAIMQRFGLTTQMTNKIYIATQKAKHNRFDREKNIHLIKPVVKITHKNYKYLQLLDAIKNKYKVKTEIDDLNKHYKKLIKQLDIDVVELVFWATKYNDPPLVNKVAKLMGEIKYETTL